MLVTTVIENYVMSVVDLGIRLTLKKINFTIYFC